MATKQSAREYTNNERGNDASRNLDRRRVLRAWMGLRCGNDRSTHRSSSTKLTRGGMASDNMNNVLKDKKELLEKTENIARKAAVINTRVYNSSDTFGGNVPPHKPKPKCPHCGKTLPQD
jgi:hypothetical protein